MEDPEMASSSPQERTNYARLCRLVVDIGGTVLCDTFDSIHPPANLHVVLSSPSTLRSLRKKTILNPLQWRKLFPAVASTVSSANFDVTLLMVLLRNICGLSPPVSTGNWDQHPPDSDNSTEANIVRIKCYRDEVYAHATEASVDDPTFNLLWQKISSAVLALGSGTNDSPLYETVINELATAEWMDPAAKTHYIKLLSDWKQDDDTLKETLENQQKTNNELGEIKENQERTNFELVEIKERSNFELGEVKENQEITNIEVGEVKGNQERAKEQLGKTEGNQERDNEQLGKIEGNQERVNEQLGKIEVSDPFSLEKCISIIRQLYEDRKEWLAPFPCSEEFQFSLKGFTQTDAKHFIQRYFREKEEDLAEKLLDKLGSDRSLQDLTADPLNIALFCFLCKDFRGKLPESRTLLYLEMVECMLRRYRLKMKLPETDQGLVALYQVELKQLGRIAMEGLHYNSMYFDHRAFQGFSSDLILGLGFLSVEAGRSKRRPGRSYVFLHKSFQEFFAALYLCGQLLDGQISVYRLISDRRYFGESQQVLMFTTGILAQKCEVEVKELIVGLATQVSLNSIPLEVALACINECKREDNAFEKEMAQLFGSRLQLETVDCSGFNKELAAVAIEMMYTNSTVTDLSFFECHIDDANAHALAKELKENLMLTSLYLMKNCIDEFSKVNALAKGLKENSTLTMLNLSHNGICDKESGVLAEALKENSTLEKLDLSNNAIGDVGADALANGLKENSTLEKLDLSSNLIGEVGADALAGGLKENSTLEKLDLSTNAIGEVGADALAEGLKENSTLKLLDLSSNNAISDVGIDALAKVLKENSTLKELHLSSLSIGKVGADALAEGLKENSTLKLLDLSHNNAIGDVGIDALTKRLKENSTLKELHLSGISIGKVGADALAERLKENSTLKLLDLSRNNAIGDFGIDALAKGLKENSTLKELRLSSISIGKVGADALAEGLKENSTLTLLDLSHNNAIGRVGADALAKGLKKNSTLKWLNLSHNGISDFGADALAKGLKENSTLKWLNLSHNGISDFGADALAKGLKENSTLKWLDLSHNEISDFGADALAKGLRQRKFNVDVAYHVYKR